jgi:hypothetical protein
VKCPYCVSELSDQALVCPHCTRDLYLIKPLLEKIEVLEQQVRELTQTNAAAASSSDDTAFAAPPPAPFGTRTDWLFLWLAPLLLLLAAHATITVILDLNTLYLRLVSLLIPLPFAFLLMRRDRSFPFWMGAAFTMAVLAVLGMSGVISAVDRVPLLPQDGREWREFAEYAASIGFSYVTGMILGRMLRQRREAVAPEAAKELTVKVVNLLSTGKKRADQLQATIKKVQEVRGTVTALTTAGLSVYTGLQGFWGRGG